MDSFIIAGILLGLCFLAWSAFAINKYSEREYGYEPFNIYTTLGVSGIGLVLLFCTATATDPEAYKYALALMSTVTAALLVRISLKTNVLIGIYSTIIICLTSIIISAIFILFMNRAKR